MANSTFYFSTVSYTGAYGYHSDWDSDEGMHSSNLEISKAGGLTTGTNFQPMDTFPVGTTCTLRGVTDGIPNVVSLTTATTFQMYMRSTADNSGANPRVVVYLLNSSGGLKGTLLSITGTNEQMSVSPNAKGHKVFDGTFSSGITTAVDDKLVVEYGFRPNIAFSPRVKYIVGGTGPSLSTTGYFNSTTGVGWCKVGAELF